jgi:hypothetical protein
LYESAAGLTGRESPNDVQRIYDGLVGTPKELGSWIEYGNIRRQEAGQSALAFGPGSSGGLQTWRSLHPWVTPPYNPKKPEAFDNWWNQDAQPKFAAWQDDLKARSATETDPVKRAQLTAESSYMEFYRLRLDAEYAKRHEATGTSVDLSPYVEKIRALKAKPGYVEGSEWVKIGKDKFGVKRGELEPLDRINKAEVDMMVGGKAADPNAEVSPAEQYRQMIANGISPERATKLTGYQP